MLALRVRIKEIMPPDVTLREWNKWIALAFREAGEYWIREFLPQHFTPGAVQRYRYQARKRQYLERKRRARLLRDWRGRHFVPTKPPLPLVYSGAVKDELLSRPISAFNIRATATSNRQSVKVPLRLPHPMRAQQLSELRAMIHEEERFLAALIVNFMREVVKDNAIQNTRHTQIGAFGGFRNS